MLSRIAVATFAFCFLAALLLSFKFSVADVSALPSGFTDELVTSVGAPTALAFTPDGRLLITTQGGQVRVYQNGSLLATPAVDLSSRLCTNSERGLLGVAVDPQFTTNRYVYFFYTFNKNNVCPTGQPTNASNPVNRVSRFVLGDNNIINTASETILIDNIHSPNGNHNGGDLHFGKDGLLYISVGDGGADYAGNSGGAGANDAARDKHVLLGKILRITRDGAIPSGNPFQGANSGRCNATGITTAGNWCQETFASGLRNPFRIAFDSNASVTRFFINDVGQGAWEEIDEGAVGADYGWNVREGHCANGSTTDCGAPPAGMTNPIFDYPRGCVANTVSGNSITGGAFVPNGVWSSEYDDSYLFGEYVCGKIFRIKPNGTGGYTASEFNASSTGSVTSLIFGPYQSTQALYYTNYTNGGQVRRIRYTGTANRSPVASATANPSSGSAPLNVSFNASASSDADGDTLSFSWNFGDGTTGNGATPTHSYVTNGTYNAIVTVTDGRGGSDTATVRIDVGNGAPTPTITSPTATQLFRVGETITLQGSATDPQDGNLPSSALTWEVLLHHNNDHTHPFLPPTSGNNITFTAPAPEDLAAATASFLEIRLTATDSTNLTTTVTRYFYPRKVNVTFATNPAGLNLTVNGTNVAGGTTVVSWDGYGLNVNAPTQTVNGNQYAFQSWSDGGAQAHTITTPATAATYTATFRLVSVTVSGTINYAITPATLVPGVNLNAVGTPQLSAASNNSGFYQISGLTAGGNYTVTPSKTGNINGISPFDATLILRCIAAGPANCALTENQKIAADTSNDDEITPFDATQILRFVAANRQTDFTGEIGNWKFSPISRPYNSVSNSASNQNYEAFLIGDVNGSWTPSGN
ncbi:MAG TPA: PQQ-dependent sugar dehydrogenase [Pyrinomonadaceae bacterium]